MTINLHNYIGEFIILITNDAPIKESIEGLPINGRTNLYEYEVENERRFVLARALTEEDLHYDNEDYINYLQNQWGSEDKIKKFLTDRVIHGSYLDGKPIKKK